MAPNDAGGLQAARGPLTPAVCALALLPREQGRQHAPATLRPLMDAGSPIAALYDTCTECEEHIEAVKAADLKVSQVCTRTTPITTAFSGVGS